MHTYAVEQSGLSWRWRVVLACLVVAGGLPVSALAWVATAIDDQGHTFTYGNAATADDARAHALARCLMDRGEDAGCTPWAADNAKSIVIAKGVNRAGAVEVIETNHADPVYAAEAALAHCRQRADDCRIVLAEWDAGPTWASVARSGNTIAVALDKTTEQEARDHALAECRRDAASADACEVIEPVTQAGRLWYAQAEQADAAGQQAEVGVYMSPESEEDAASRVVHHCSEEFGACNLKQVVENKGAIAAPDALHDVQAQQRSHEMAPAHYASARVR